MKKPWLSKTLWVNLILGITAMIAPGASELIKAHPEAVMTVFSIINMGLRLMTKDAISLED